MNSPLNEKLQSVEWGEFTYTRIFNKIVQGQRLKKDDQLPGDIPFVMAGTTNAGVVNYVSNPVARFPKNSITADIFGNVFYRGYDFGAGDDTGVYWNDEKEYSKEAMLFFVISMQRSLSGKFSYGSKLRSSQSLNFKLQLPIKNGDIDFDFMESFIADLEAERIADLEAYLQAAGLKDYELTEEERRALETFGELEWREFNIVDLFDVNNSRSILSRDIVENSGETPYLCASAENNAVSTYIAYDEFYLDKGDCFFIGGKTFVVTYQAKDFYSNDSHNLTLHLKGAEQKSKLNQLFMVACISKGLRHRYSWGDSISNKKIQTDKVSLPAKDNSPDYAFMEIFISAIQKLAIREVVQYADRKIAAASSVCNSIG